MDEQQSGAPMMPPADAPADNGMPADGGAPAPEAPETPEAPAAPAEGSDDMGEKPEGM